MFYINIFLYSLSILDRDIQLDQDDDRNHSARFPLFSWHRHLCLLIFPVSV